MKKEFYVEIYDFSKFLENFLEFIEVKICKMVTTLD